MRVVSPIGLFAVVVVVVAASACTTPRVYLPAAPPRDAPLVERERAFETLRPVGNRAAAPLAPMGTSPWFARSYVVLGGGARVEDPRDLVAVVGAGPVKDAAERADALETEALLWNGAGWSMIGVGAAVSFGSLGLLTAMTPAGTPEEPLPPEAGIALGGVVVGSVVMLSALIPTFVGSMRQGDANVEKDTAFILYGDALRRRLDLPQNRNDLAANDVNELDVDVPERLR